MISQLKVGALISYATVIFNIIAGLFYTPWMISEIGKDEYGLYSLVVAFLSYFLLDFGIGSVISTYVAKARARNDFDFIKRIIGVCYKAYFIITAASGICLFVLCFFLSDIFQALTIDQLHKFQVIYVIAGLFSLCSFPLMPISGIMVAYEKFAVSRIADFFCKFFSILFIIICLLNGYGLYSLVAVNGFCAFITAVIKYVYVNKKLHISFELSAKLDKTILHEITAFSIWVFVIGLAQRLIVNISPTILGVFCGADAIAVFSIAVALEGYVWTFANCLNGLFVPKVSQYIEQGRDKESITDTMIQVGRFQLYIAGSIIFGILSLGYPFIKLWVGDSFENSYFVVICLLIPNLILLTQEIANTLIWVENKVKFRALIYIACGFISTTLSIIAAPRFGAIGCGMAILCSLLISIIVMNRFYSKVLHLNICRFYKDCHFRIVPIMLIPTGIVVGLSVLHFPNTWLKLILYAVLFITLQLIFIYTMCMNKSEKSILKLF